ncbi:hypothetical protein BSKO_13960 [Bryopsis sp. KO-2023]|nr:hypothetical protein BSKO_13960 [Bryopsis sp. KO-2023]
MDNCCVVCAEPLEWTAYGPCGHMDTCSKCVARLRLILDDKRCVICQQEAEEVYVSRFMGDYTTRVGPDKFPQLKDRAKRRELFYMPLISAFFDDEDHFKDIRGMSSFTHSVLKDKEDVPKFRTLGSLRNYIQEHFKKQFCGICLTGRKVFVSEQIVYGKNELARHLKQGDLEGPLAQAGFKGHPQCRFCSKRFYGDHELFTHNHQNHETCFLCRRINPEHYTYYRDYNQLEEHFRGDHYPCPHPECLEKKFVVFVTEAELKQHFTKEHNDGTMSRSQMREALTVETNFQYRRPRQEEAAPPEVDHRAGVVIGGGGNFRSRHGRGRGPEPDMTRAIQNSLQTVTLEGASASTGAAPERQPGPQLTAADFPSLPEGSAGFASAGQSNGNWGGAAGLLQGGNLRQEDFPSLPTQTKSAKRRAKIKEKKTMAEQLLARNGQVKVVQRTSGSGSQPSPNSLPMRQPPQSSPPVTVNPPYLSSAQPMPVRPAILRQPPPQQPALPRGVPPAAGGSGMNLRAKDFPALGRSDAGSSTPQPTWNAKSQPKPAPKVKPKPAKPTAPRPEDFPTLGAGGSRQKSGPASAWNGSSPSGSGRVNITPSLSAAHVALSKRIKQQISGEQYKELQRAAEGFTGRSVSADDYHDTIVRLEIAQYAASLISVCPIADLRMELLEVHRRFVEFATKNPDAAPTQVPVDILVAALKNTEEKQAWWCSKCKVTNAPQADFCESCDQQRPVGGEKPRANDRQAFRGGSRPGGLGKKKDRGLFGANVECKNGNSVWGKRK